MMGRSALPSTDRSVVWLAHLIEAAEVVAASAEPCNPAAMNAFSHRLAMGADARRGSGPCASAPEGKARNSAEQTCLSTVLGPHAYRP